MNTNIKGDFQICISVALSELRKKKNKWSIKTGKDKKGTLFILEEYFISASNSDVYTK